MTSASQDQLERARKTWELVVLDVPADSPGLRLGLKRSLRLKSFELDDVLASLPGRVRCGARADLLPLLERLLAEGVHARIQRNPQSR